jgi:long-chain acyl-CoA synthetase
MRNDFPLFEAATAAALLGIYAVPTNWHYGEEEAHYVFTDCGAKALLIHADLLRKIESAIPEHMTVLVAETPPEIAATYGIPESQCSVPEGYLTWGGWLGDFDPMPPRDMPAPGAMIYTSGTTGLPKGVRRSPVNQDQVTAMQAVINTAFDFKPGKRRIIPAPMYHSAPNAYSGYSVAFGLDEIVLMPRFDLEDGALLDPAEVQAHVREHLAGYKVPKVVEFLDELPREDSGKIFKRKLKEPYWEGRDTRI